MEQNKKLQAEVFSSQSSHIGVYVFPYSDNADEYLRNKYNWQRSLNIGRGGFHINDMTLKDVVNILQEDGFDLLETTCNDWTADNIKYHYEKKYNNKPLNSVPKWWIDGNRLRNSESGGDNENRTD